MTKWGKINILDIGDNKYKSFFNEKYGLINSISVSTILVNSNNEIIKNVYIEDNDNDYFVQATELDIKNCFLKKFYTLTCPRQPIGNYGFADKFDSNSVVPITDFKYRLIINFSYLSYSPNYGINRNFRFRSAIEEIVISKADELKKFELFASKDIVANYFYPAFMTLKEGQQYYYVTKGLCSINKVYEWKDENSPICNVIFASDGTNLNVFPNDIKFVEIPMNHKSEFDIFNEPKNELFLQPLIKTIKDHNLINVMWQPIEDAARYVIKLYKIQYFRGKRDVYFLKNVEVDRNDYWIAIHDIIIENVVIVVTAENRYGELVAKSKGIDVLTGKIPIEQ